MNAKHIEELVNIESYLVEIMHSIESTGKNKKVVKQIDKAISEIENACYNLSCCKN